MYVEQSRAHAEIRDSSSGGSHLRLQGGDRWFAGNRSRRQTGATETLDSHGAEMTRMAVCSEGRGAEARPFIAEIVDINKFIDDGWLSNWP